jgi:chromatin modification-related protein VID21
LDLTRNPTLTARGKTSDLIWTPQDDATLKQLAEKYPNNWILVAEAFNTLRVSASIDKRSPLDCYERWRTRFGGATAEDEHRPPPQTPTTQMTTRGTKRSMSTNVAAAASAGTPGGSQAEPKKRRRHNLMFDTIRKAAKKREAAQKANGMV